MKVKDKLIIKHKDDFIQEMIYMASTQTQHLFADAKNLVGPDETAVLWSGDIGAKSFWPIKKKHNFIQLDENTWELDVEPIDKNDL